MRTLCLFVAATGLAFAQLDSDTITITATGQTPVLQPDELNVYLSVNAVRELVLEDVLKALAGVAVSERDLTGVNESRLIGVCIPSDKGCSPTKHWDFAFTRPLTKLNETMQALASIEAAPQSGISLSYSLSSDASAAAQECAYPTVISQARRHAENVAAAAGLRVGPIVAMSDGTGALQAEDPAVPTAGLRVADFSTVTVVGALLTIPSPAASPTCTAVVQYKLLR
jgi:hypothetical protein